MPDPANPQSLNRYAYVLNNPLKYTDPSGHWVETALDVAGIIWDIHDIKSEGLNFWTGAALVVDVACLVAPVVTGGGVAVRAISHADDAIKVVNRTDSILDTAKVAARAEDVFGAHHMAYWWDLYKSCASDWWDEVVTHIAKGSTVRGVNSDRVVLGSFAEYINTAISEGKTFFNMPGDIWDMLKADPTAIWDINRKFLDDMITEGKSFEIVLGQGKGVGFYLQREIDYLLEQGYKWLDGVLVPPGL